MLFTAKIMRISIYQHNWIKLNLENAKCKNAAQNVKFDFKFLVSFTKKVL